MSGFTEGENLFPERFDDYVGEDTPDRVGDVFIDSLDISGLGFKTEASDTAGLVGRYVANMARNIQIQISLCVTIRSVLQMNTIWKRRCPR